jgi:putative tryptophan/tyrosine transport system substrate-binding protein
MRRRFAGYVAAVALGFLCTVIIATAQPSAKVSRIGWLGQGAASGANQSLGDFQQGLRDLGYINGQNLVIEYRYAGGSAERLPELAAELVRLKVDVIVTSGDAAALAATRATNVIPIVATEFGSDPVKAGWVASLGRPGGNVTGIEAISEELWQKRLGLFKQVVPKLSRMAVLWNPANPGNASCLAEIQVTAKTMGLEVRSVGVGDAKALERAFADVTKEPPDGLATCWDSVTLEYAKPIADFALKLRLPTMAPLKEYVDAGALMSFGAGLPAHRRRAAYYVDKILKGAKPADLPVERPTIFELVVNLPTAKALGLQFPPTLLVLADDVVQ